MRLLVLLSGMWLFFSCSQHEPLQPMSSDLAGEWKMVSVVDIPTSAIDTKASGIPGDVKITFAFVNVTTGTIQGNTPSNSLSANFMIGQNQMLSIPAVSATKVMESSWGFLFMDHITQAAHYTVIGR